MWKLRLLVTTYIFKFFGIVHSKMTSPGGGRGLPKMVTTSDKRLEGVTHYRDVDHFCFYTYHLFYFFIFVNHNSSCLLYYLFYVLMSIKNLLLTSLSIVAYYQRRCLVCISAEQFSVFLEIIYQHFSRTPYYFRRLRCSFTEHLTVLFWDHISVFLHSNSKYFFKDSLQQFC